MYDIKEIKILHSEKEVNEYLEKGWRILKIVASDCFVLGLEKSKHFSSVEQFMTEYIAEYKKRL